MKAVDLLWLLELGSAIDGSFSKSQNSSRSIDSKAIPVDGNNYE